MLRGLPGIQIQRLNWEENTVVKENTKGSREGISGIGALLFSSRVQMTELQANHCQVRFNFITLLCVSTTESKADAE